MSHAQSKSPSASEHLVGVITLAILIALIALPIYWWRSTIPPDHPLCAHAQAVQDYRASHGYNTDVYTPC